MKKVDINVDIGEGFSNDEALLEFATSANVCCGRHAGNWELTKETIFLCRQKGVRVGMHPGFPDRENMGRIFMKHDEVAQYSNSILEQAVEFYEYAHDVAYLKPHGAWYNMLVEKNPTDRPLHHAARLILEGAISATAIPVMLLRDSPIINILRKEGDLVIEEGFADRGYAADGTLLPRTLPGAVLKDKSEVGAQVLKLAPLVDSICIHGDTPDCLEFAEFVYKTLEGSGFEVGF